MKKINLVLFDLDGVLVDACDWHYQALNRALNDFSFPIISEQDHITKFNGLPTKVKLEMLGIEKSFSNEINNLKQKYTIQIISEFAKIMPEKIELHSYLKKNNIKIACVTNSIRETAELMLKVTGQIDYFDLIVSNEDVKNNKPHPDCYNHAIEVLDADPSFCLCVEDSPKGIESAKNSRAKNLWIVKNTQDVNLQNFKFFMEKI